MKKAFVIFLIILFSIFLFSNCKIDVNNNESASSIEQIKITQEPYKTKYFRGEKLDLSGLTIVAVYKDGHEETITDYTVFPSEGETLNYVGNKEVIVRKTKQGSKDSFIYFTSFYIEIEEKTKVYNPTEGFIFVEGETIVGCDEYSSQGNGVFPEGRIVHLSDFYLCDHEVTQGEYENIMGNNPSSATLKNATEGEIQKCRPVENISWYEAIVYCNRLSIKKGLTPCYIIQGIDNFETLPNSEIPTEYNENWDNVVFDSTADGYRLPTEAEWEFAARGGKKTYGTSSFKEDSGIDIALVEWNIINSDGKTHEVKLKTPNSLSFFDIGGNVHELCWDWRKEIEAEEITNPKGDKNGSKRVIRGGSFNSSLESNSFLERSGILPYDKDSSIGMRIARSISSSSSSESETNSYTINYISAYGQRPDPINLYEGNILTVRNLPELTCTGYTFMGWYASSSFEENTKISSGYTITGNLTLYAKWAKISNTESEIIQPDNAQIKLIVQKPEKSIIRVKKGDGIQLQGIISAMSGKPTLSISRQGEDDESEVQIWSHEYTDDEGEENAASGFYDYGYNHVIPETWFNQAKSQQYRLILRVSNGKTIEDEKTIIYDVDGPEISITDVKPVVELSGKEIINKTFKVKGTITDRYDSVESASWTLIKKGEGEGNDEVIDSGSDLKETFVITVDTKDYDNTDVVLIITAYDKAGNRSVTQLLYYINQSTDIPTIEPNDPATLTFDYKTKDELINGNNALIEAQGNNSEGQDVRKNFYTGGSQIIMKFTDDDGINRITVNATVHGETEPSNTTTVEAKGATEYTYAYKAPESEGYFQIDVTVTDVNVASKSEKFYILVSGETPSVKLTTSPEFITTNENGTAPNAKKNFTIIGNNSGSAPFKYVLREVNGDTENAEELNRNQYTESVEGKGDSSDRKRWVDYFTPDADEATGNVKYTIYDNYGISASETFYYKTDSIRPTSTITSCMDENTSNSGTFRFVGTAADNETGSGVASVQIRIDNYNEDDGDTLATSWAELPATSQKSTGWIDASGTENWNLLVDLSEYPNVFGAGKEGKKVLYVRVTDGVGNYNELTEYNATTKEGARKVFIYDKLDPAVSIREYTGADDGETVQLGSRNSFEIKQLFNLTGTYSDGYGIDDIEIEQTFGEDTVVIGGVNCDELNDGSWSWDVENLPRSMDSPNNGQTSIVSGKYIYKVTVTDKAGKTSSENVTVTIDITPPTIGITKPIGNTTGADGSIIKNFVSGDSYMFQGTITDNENGTGIDKYYYFLTADGTIPDDTSVWVYATSEENWSFTKTIASGPGAVSGSDLYEGEWTLYVKAVDKAGNESAVVSRAFSIDKAVPRLTIDGNTLSNSGTTYFKEASYTISGTAEDTHGIDYITIRSGSTVLANIAGTEITNGNWTVQLQLEENTAISISIIATDKAGRTSDTITRSFYRDTQAPSIWTTSDLTGLFTSTGSGITIQGSVNDGAGSGVDKVLYSIDGSEPSLEATVTNQTWTVNFTSTNLPSEGMYILKIKAVDKLGNITAAPVTGTIVYDTAKPNLTINLNDGTSRTVTNNSSLIVSSSNYGISGTFSDTGTNVTVSAGLDCSDSTAAVIITQNPATGKSGTWSLSQTRRNGTQTVTDIPDGIYEYTVTAVDEAGVYTGSSARKESIKFKVTKDTTPPVITSIAVPDRETAKITQFTFSGVTEDVTSGVASVKLTISDGTNTTVFSTDATDNSLKISGLERWSKEVVYANYPVFNTEGNKTVTVEAKDKAGKTATQTVTFIYDKANPVLTVDESTLQEYMNDQGYILNGTAADSYGLASVEIIEKYNGVETGLETITVGANNIWQVRVPLGNVTPNEGRYDYTIVAKDTAGNVTTSRNYVTYVDKTSPLIGIARPVTTALLTGAINESQASFSGSVSDPVDSNSNEVASGIHAVWYKILARNETAPVPPASTSVALQDTAWNGWTKAIAGASLWNFNQAFEQGTTAYNAGNLPEGRYTLYVAAVDNAGMVSEVASRNFDVDMSAPTLTESSSSEYQTRVGFTLSGTVSDTHGLASLQIRDTYKDLSGIITPGNNEAMTCTSGTWAKSFVVGSSNSSANNYLADGEHTFTVTATDIMGKTTTVRRVVTVDTEAPVITVTTPQDNNKTGINSINETTFKFDGGIIENNTGVKAVWYKILPATAIAPTAPASGLSSMTDATWTADNWIKATSGNTLWSANQTFTSGTTDANFGEGDKKLYVYAVDNVGNVSAAVSAANARSFTVDMTPPVISSTITTGTNCITQSSTYYFNAALTGTVSASDTYAMADSYPVTVSINGVANSTVTPNDSGVWTISTDKFTQGATQVVTITATDKVGRTSTKSFNIYYDNTAPTVGIENPPNNSNITTATVTANGPIFETGVGLDKIQYTTMTSPTESDWNDIEVNPGSTSWSQQLIIANEGPVSLQLRAYDKLGNASTVASSSFNYDSTSPTLTVTNLVANEYKNANFTLTGTAWDSNAIESINVKDDGKSGDWTYNFTDTQRAIAKSDATKVTWNFDFVTGTANSSAGNFLSEGLHTFIITLTDVADRTTQQTITFTVDTGKPEITTLPTPTVDETESTNATYKFIGAASDETSTVTDVYIAFVDPTSVAPADYDSTSTLHKANGSTTWTYTLTFANEGTVFSTSGVKTVWARAKDRAGNWSNWASQTFNYDTRSPNVAVTGIAVSEDGTTYNATESIAVGITSLNTNKLFKLSGTASDDWDLDTSSPITITQTFTAPGGFIGSAVTISGTGFTVDGTGQNRTWTITGLPRNPDSAGTTELATGTFQYIITAKDKVNKTKTATISVRVDVDGPIVNITTPNGNMGMTDAISGDSYTFRGTANDVGISELESYSYAFVQSSIVPPADSNEWVTVTAADGTWSITKDLIAGTSPDGTGSAKKLCEGQWYLYFKAKDKAGNETSDVCRSFYVDLSAPALTSTITTGTSCISLNGTYYFNGNLTGTASATDTYAMAASNPVTFRVGTESITPTWNGTTWTIATSAFDETYQTLTITATDAIGRTAITTYNICKDTTEPMVSIIRPESNGNIDVSPVNARISVIENGVGIQGKVGTSGQAGYVPSKVEYRFNGGEWTPTGYTSGTTVEQELDLGTTQGQMTLEVRATDKLGNTYTTPATTFYYDYQDPVIVETDSVARYVNGAFTLTGTAYDTYRLAYIEVKDTIDGNKVYRSNSDTNTQITITGNIQDAVSSATATTWTLAFTADDWADFSEGNHVFKITAVDVSGRTAEAPNKNVWIDKHAPVVTSATVPTTFQTQGSSYRFSGTAKDYNRNAGTANSNSLDSGIKEIKIQITNNGTAASNTATVSATGWIDVTGQEDWNAVVAFEEYDVFNTEGIKTLHVRATDESGLTSTVYTKNFVYDKAAPSLSVSTYTPDGGSALSINSTDNEPIFNVNGNFALSGSASDTNGIKQVIISQRIGYEEPVVIETLEGNGATTFNWTTNTGTGKGLPRNPTTNEASTGNALTSGIYTYTVTVTDVAGNESITEATAKTASKTVKATIDKTAPEVAIINPANENANTGLNAISVVSNRFAGTASDNHEGATDVEAVWYKIIARDGTVPSAPSASTTVDNTWTDEGFTKASNTTNWFFSQAMNEGTTASDSDHICEGRYRLVVYAVDKAGNVSETPATRYFDVDMNAPAIETKLDDEVLDESMTQTKIAAYTFKYKVTETYGLAADNPVVTMKKDNAVFTDFTQSSPDVDGYVTVSISSQTDGLYEYTISATDLVGKNSTIRRNILLDTTSPTLTVTSPDLSGYQNSTSVKVNGSSEDKSGTQAVWYSFGAASMPAKPTSNTKADASWTAKGWTKASGTTSWSFTVNGVEGTDKNLYIAAVDTNGAVTTSGTISALVKVDVTNPELTEDGIGAGTQYKKADYTLSGSVSDSGSGLIATNPVTISDGTNTYHPTVTAGKWSQTIDTASLAEAEYTYTITAEDKAGRVSTLTRTVVFDKTAPTVSTKAIGSVATGVKKTISSVDWYNTTQIPVTIAGSDNLSGVSYIECSTDWDSTAQDTDNGNWTTLSRSGDNYVGQISCTTQGTNTIYIRVTDQAGNTSTPSSTESITVNVDTAAPETFNLISGASATGVNLIHGRDPITFTFTVTDNTNGSGIVATNGVVLTGLGNGLGAGSIAATATGNANEYSITIPANQLPTTEDTPINVVITAKDEFDHAATFTAFQLQMDNTYPGATVNAIDDADKSTTSVTEVNGIITVSGTTSDTNTITAVKLQYQTSANGTSDWSTWADYEGTREGTMYNWRYSIDTTSAFSDNTYVRFRALATDRAGNTGNTGTATQYSTDNAASNQLVKVSQYTDRPVIRFTNINLGTSTIWLKNANTIYGLISDDDGDVTDLYYMSKLSTEENWPATWTELTPVAGSGYFEITNVPDGQSTIRFKTTDKASKLFQTDTSASPNTLNEPVLSDGTNKLDGLTGSATVELTLKVDKTSPVIQNAKFQIYNTDLATPAWGSFVMDDETHAMVWTANAWSISLPTLGGKYTKFKMKLEAKDQNGVQSVTSTFNSGTPAFTCAVANPVADDQWHEWATGEIAVPNNVTQVMPFAITITDGAGLTREESVQVEVDNSAPEITITEPSSLIGTNETMRGNISTTNADESRETKLYYAVSRAPQTEALAANYDPTTDYKPRDDGYIRYEYPDDNTSDVIATRWTEIEGLTTQLNWFVYFDDGTGTDHTNRFAKYLTENYLGYTTNTALTNNQYNDITYVYFWIRAIDSTGNTSYAYKRLKIDPQGDRPTVTLSYPTNIDNQPPVLGGTIRLNGTATDNEAAKYVWVQIDKNNNGTFDATDLAYMNTNNGTTRTYGYKLGQISTNTEKTISEIAAVVTAGTNINDYGIMVTVNGQSWFTNINSQLEYSPSEGGQSTIRFIIYATDESTVGEAIKISKSLPVTQTITLDADSPVIVQQSLKLVQYAKADGTACTDGSVTTGTIANEMAFTDGMSIKGKWFLIGDVTDPSGIKEIWIGAINALEQKLTSLGADYTPESGDDDFGIRLVHDTIDGHENCYHFQIPMGNDEENEVGIYSKTFKAVENTTNSLPVEKTYSVQYDNKAPVIKTSGANVNLNTSITDSSGFFTFGAVASEDNVNNVAQSGVERIAFYFTRDMDYNIKDIDDENNPIYGSHNGSATQTHDLFDVMIKNENRDNDDTTSGNEIIDYATSVTFNENTGAFTPSGIRSGYVYEDGLIWQQVTGATISLNSVTLSSVGKNVHKGGLAKINGAFYKITGITGTSVTLSGNPGDTTNGTILFAIANIVDISDKIGSDTLGSYSNGYGTYGYGYYVNNAVDDGDLMIESFNKQGTDWIWDATIKSTNLPDGPITLHIVAMDGAGNIASYAYTATVQNNGPRIAGIKIGNDENGNNVIDDEEFITDYSGFYVNGKRGNQEMHTVTLPEIKTDANTGNQIITSAIKAKGMVEIQPEIVGGNGALKYTYSVFKRNAGNTAWNDTSSHNMNTPTSLGTGRPVSSDDSNPVYADLNYDSTLGRRKGIILTVADFVQHSLSGEKDKFVFTIGDNTPAATSGGNPQNATLNVIMDVAVEDINPAKNYIIPFYWKKKAGSTTEVVSSLFKNSREQGHIELPKDWVFSKFYRPYNEYDTTDTIHLFDQDPKVSGKIKIEGIAQDDVLLKDIILKFNKSFDGINGFTADTSLIIATYSNGTWTYPVTGTNLTNEATGTINTTTGWSANVTQATYGDLLAANIIAELPTIGNSNIQFAETDLVPYSSQEYGHVVHWTLYLDTAKLSTIAATEVTLEATATDRGNPTWNGSTGSVDYAPNNAVVTISAHNSGYTGAVTTTGSGDSFTVSTNELTGKLKMDIVPYITKITTALTNKLSSKIRAAYSRTACGHYITRSDETITITGFNLGDNSTHKPRYNGTTNLINSTGTTVALPISNIAASGEIYLTVNGVETLNNMNNNNSSGHTNVTITEASSYDDKNNYAYNRMPNRTSNNLLTDDVVVDVWEFDSDAAKPNNGDLSEPIMRINPVNGTVGVAFVSGPLNFAMPGNTSSSGVSSNGSYSVSENANPGTKDIYSYSLWQNNYDAYRNIALCFDENGYAHATATGLDTNPTTKHAGRFSYFYNRWGRSGTDTKGNYEGLQAIRLESIAVPKGNFTIGYNNDGTGGVANRAMLIKGSEPSADALVVTRFYSPSIVTTVNGSNTSVYLAYYDSVQGQIRFRYNSELKTSWSSTSTEDTDKYNGTAASGSGINNLHHANNDKDDFVDNLGYFTRTGTATAPTSNTYYENYMEASTEHFSLIAGVDYQKNYPTGYDTGYTGYKYVAIDAIGKNKYSPAKDNDIVVAVWYDGTSLRYAYNDNPASGLDNGNANGWKGNKPIFANGGEHCAIKVDSNKGIHIAAYANNTLRYAYLPTYDYADYDEETDSVIVDSFVITGERITIDAGLELVPGTSTYVVIPYISYYNSTARLPAVAHPVAKTAMDYTADGTDSDDIFTGNWEVSLVPTSKSLTINYNDKINLALWKNGSGNIVASNDSYFASSPVASKSSANNESTESYGHIYGNRTSNPIMGYAIESIFGSVLETAQKR